MPLGRARSKLLGWKALLVPVDVRVAVVVVLLAIVGCSDDDQRATPTSSSALPESTQPSSTTAISSATATTCTPIEPVVHQPDEHQIVDVFVFCGPGVAYDLDLRRVSRLVPADAQPLTAALTQLLIGVTPEEAATGLASAFSSYTAGGLRSADIDGGIAVLDFTNGFVRTGNFGTSNLSAVVMMQIEATVFQFPEVTGLDLRVDGERFCGWEATCEGAAYPLRSRDSE